MMSRRQSLAALAGLPATAAAAGALAQPAPSAAAGPKRNFEITGIFMNSAYTHPLPLDSAAAVRTYLAGRVDPALRKHPVVSAPALFARLINASPDEIAETPSTSYGESFVMGALGLKDDPAKAKVVTDILHFDGSLYSYGELAKRGLDLTILPMTPEGRIDMNRLEAAVDHRTRLVSISLVSMINGFEHDLKTVCEIAHRKGAYVYVDAVQAAGAVPIDVRASGVDFLACSSFKWLMGDFGYGFLYVRQDLLPKLKRDELGYQQVKSLAYHAFPGDPPGERLFEAAPDDATAGGFFRVGTTSEAAEVAVGVSLGNILEMGVEKMQRDRQPLIERLRTGLSGRYRPLTPPDSKSSIIAFECLGAADKLRPRIHEAQVNVQLYRNRFRISPSIFNTMAEVDRVIATLTA